jgi:hypothetical protein
VSGGTEKKEKNNKIVVSNSAERKKGGLWGRQSRASALNQKQWRKK